MLYTVTLAWGRTEDVASRRDFVVEADREATAFEAAVQELKTQLLIEAANVQPWAVSYHRGGGRRVQDRLEYLRGELRAERISYGELAELQGLAEHIEAGDVELLEAAGVPEFPDADEA